RADRVSCSPCTVYESEGAHSSSESGGFTSRRKRGKGGLAGGHGVGVPRLDVTAARVALNDLDGAHEAIRPVLDLPAERRIQQLGASMARIRSALAAARFARTGLARSLAAALDEFRASEAARSLGSGQ
ncbi:MAG: hypothetical protein ACRDQG_18120, partial [Pseudonocardiaceae bacterium]